ncbi:hypothetical protein K0M31_008251 [Melipona bicolor]|uniref:Uncharacterized protein n=1 Tax=Melipona bicolor TaxID=60889 RepID=A0AA40FQL1_9HYME|nr:hypothetical protein K0M31_008251 [Melipona bicolor]
MRMLKEIIMLMLSIQMISSQSEGLPGFLGGIENVANSASNFLSGFMQRQKELIHRVTDTASNYITTAVETPKNLIINATKLTTGYIDSAASKGLEFKIRRIIEKIRARMPYGIPELGIPALEPFHLDELYINFDNPDIGNISIVLENLSLYNLSTFVVNKAKLSLIGPIFAANISVPKIHIEGFYNISGDIGNTVDLQGSGPFKADVYDFQLYVSSLLGFRKGVYLKTFYMDFSLRSIDINLENFTDDDELTDVINKVVRELTPKVIEFIKPDILPGIQSYVGNKINETIQQITLKDVMSVLGNNEIREFTHLIPF